MRDYISLAAELVCRACEMDYDSSGYRVREDCKLMREAAVMLRKQGDILKRLNSPCKPEPEENSKDFKW